MKPIAIFYHSLFYLGDPPVFLPNAYSIVKGQMRELEASGIVNAATEIHCGVNGEKESEVWAEELFPPKAIIKYHSLNSRNENSTILMLERWLQDHDGWYVLYFHSKGATHSDCNEQGICWRDCMMRGVVHNWRKCVADLDSGYEAVGCHWMEPPETPEGQFIFAGNFFWSTSRFLRTLPSIQDRERIKLSGLWSLQSRYEAEVWIGNGRQLPLFRDYHPGVNPALKSCPYPETKTPA